MRRRIGRLKADRFRLPSPVDDPAGKATSANIGHRRGRCGPAVCCPAYRVKEVVPVKGQIVHSPAGDEIVLADIGLVELLDDPVVRVWDVSLRPGETHPWHLHHNPYVVLSLEASAGRMDWLDGAEPRFLNEYRGGSVYRPVSPVHRLTNIGEHFYRNRLVELKELGELRPRPVDVGPGARSVEGERPGPDLSDGRRPVLRHPHVGVWTVDVEPGQDRVLDLGDRPHVLALIDAPELDEDRTGGVRTHPGGSLTLRHDGPRPQSWFVLELSYDLDAIRA
jgi:hypothetical protein